MHNAPWWTWDAGCQVNINDGKMINQQQLWLCSRRTSRENNCFYLIEVFWVKSFDNWTAYPSLNTTLLNMSKSIIICSLLYTFQKLVSALHTTYVLTIVPSLMSPAHLTSHITRDLDSVHCCCCPLLLAAVVHSCAVEWDGHWTIRSQLCHQINPTIISKKFIAIQGQVNIWAAGLYARSVRHCNAHLPGPLFDDTSANIVTLKYLDIKHW